ANSRSTVGFSASFATMACSRPPCPTTRTLIHSPFGASPSSLHSQRLFARRTDRDHRYRHAAEIGDPVHVGPGRGRQGRVGGHGLEVLLPSLDVLVDGLGSMEDRLVRREVIVRLPTVSVGDADANG